MSIYDHRDHSVIPAERPSVPDEWAEDRHILIWWTEQHDHILETLIAEWQWSWYGNATEAILAITPSETIEAWRKQDRLCRRYAWYNVLMGFCQARVQVLGFTKAIRHAETRSCLLCGQSFIEDTLPEPFIERLGIDRLVFCSPCMRDAIFFSGNSKANREDILGYATSLAQLAGRVPPDGFGTHVDDFVGLDDESRAAILTLLCRKPSKERISKLFGKWFDVLVASGVLEDGARRTSRGTQCRARDGHLCYSLGEKTIDDLLHQLGVSHDKEPHYPESNMRADFEVNGVYIEYFGLAGDPDYDAKTELKTSLAKRHKIKLIAIYPKDVCSRGTLMKKLATVLDVPIRPAPYASG